MGKRLCPKCRMNDKPKDGELCDPCGQAAAEMKGRKEFHCSCKGSTRILTPTRVEHACQLKGAPATSFYDGVGQYLPHIRVQIALDLTGGEVRYNWFVDWN